MARTLREHRQHNVDTEPAAKELKEVIDRLEEVENDLSTVYEDLREAEFLLRCTTRPEREEILSRCNSIPPFDDFLSRLANLEGEKSVLITRGEAFSRALNTKELLYRGWTCKSLSSGMEIILDFPKLEAAGITKMTVEGTPLFTTTLSRNAAAWKLAIKKGLLDEEDLLQKGAIKQVEKTRRKYFKKTKEEEDDE